MTAVGRAANRSEKRMGCGGDTVVGRVKSTVFPVPAAILWFRTRARRERLTAGTSK